MNEYGEASGAEVRAGVATTFVASLLLGSSYVAIKLGLEDLDPFLFSAMTIGIGAVLALAVTLARGTFSWAIFRRWEAWAAPLVTFALVACQYAGLSLAPASTGALIIGANVLMVAPLSVIFFRERMGGLRIAGLLLGMLGLFLLTTGLDLGSLDGGVLLGYLLLLVATFCIALTYLLSRFALRHMTFDQWVLALHLFTPLPLLALYLIGGEGSSMAIEMAPLVLYTGLLCTALPTLLWVWGLRHIGMVSSSVIILSESTFAVLLSVAVLGEEVGTWIVVGALMVFLAIFMVVRGGRSDQARGPRSERAPED